MKRDELASRADVSLDFLEDAQAMGLLPADLETPYQVGLITWVIRLRNLRRQGMSWDEIYILTRSDIPSYGAQSDNEMSDASDDE